MTLRPKKSALNTKQPPIVWGDEPLEQGTPHTPAPQKQKTEPQRQPTGAAGSGKAQKGPKVMWRNNRIKVRLGA